MKRFKEFFYIIKLLLIEISKYIINKENFTIEWNKIRSKTDECNTTMINKEIKNVWKKKN